jgi:hypothetical protein
VDTLNITQVIEFLDFSPPGMSVYFIPDRKDKIRADQKNPRPKIP